VFIPSRLEDNPFLDREAYERSLSSLDPITRAQIRDGDWTVRPEGGMFRRSWFDRSMVEEKDLPDDMLLCRYWDLAGTEPRKGRDPDWTSGVLLGLSDGQCFVLDVRRARDTALGVRRLVRRTAERDAAWSEERGIDPPAIRMEQEPGSAGAAVIDAYAREVLGPYNFAGDRPTGSKRSRAAPVAAHAEAGYLFLVRRAWNEAFLDELTAFPLGAHDDQVDALSGAYVALWETEEFTYLVEYEDRVEISPV
jgi:predicted phage terminase large subunit-like protein